MNGRTSTFVGPVLTGPAGLIATPDPRMRRGPGRCARSPRCTDALVPEKMCQHHAGMHEHFVLHDAEPDRGCCWCPGADGLTGIHRDRLAVLTDAAWYDATFARPTDAAFTTVRHLLATFGFGTVEYVFCCPRGDGSLTVEHMLLDGEDDVFFEVLADGSVEVIEPVFDAPAGYDDNGLWFPTATAAHRYLYEAVRRTGGAGAHPGEEGRAR